MKKRLLIGFIFLFSFLGVLSCDKEESQNLHTNNLVVEGDFELEIFDTKNSKGIIETHRIKHLFSFDQQVKQFDSIENLKLFISQHPERT